MENKRQAPQLVDIISARLMLITIIQIDFKSLRKKRLPQIL